MIRWSASGAVFASVPVVFFGVANALDMKTVMPLFTKKKARKPQTPQGAKSKKLKQRANNRRRFFRMETKIEIGYRISERGQPMDEDEAAILAMQAQNGGLPLAGSSSLKERPTDLSGSGIRFKGDIIHFEEDILNLEIRLPERKKPIFASARVVRMSPFPKPPAIWVACHFLEIDTDDQDALVHHVTMLQRELLRDMRQ